MNRRKSWYSVASIAIGLLATGCYENFSDTIRVTTTGGSVGKIAVRAGADDLVLSYISDSSIRIRRSYNNGVSWGIPSEILALSDSDFYFKSTDLVADGALSNYLYAAAAEGSSSELKGANHFLRSTDGGFSWSSIYSYTRDTMRYQEVKIAQNPNDLSTIAYAEQRQESGGLSRIRVHVSTDRGASFDTHTTAVELADEPWLNDLLYMTDGTLILFYCFDDFVNYPKYYIKRSTDDGATWGSAIRVNSTVSGDYSSNGNGCLTQAGSALHAAWGNSSNFKHSFSNDGGLTWEDNEIIEWEKYLYSDLLYSETQGVLVLSYLRYGVNGYNVNYRVWSGEWSEEGRINNHLGTGTKSGGLTVDSNGIIYAAFHDKRWEFGDNIEVCVAISDPDYASLTSPVNIALEPSSIFSQVTRGESMSFSFSATNYGDAAETFDAWITYEGENGISGTLQTYSNVTLGADASGSATYSTIVPASAPAQEYNLRVHVGDATTDTWDSDGFTTRVQQ